jgi:hypothetical protein
VGERAEVDLRARARCGYHGRGLWGVGLAVRGKLVSAR